MCYSTYSPTYLISGNVSYFLHIFNSIWFKEFKVLNSNFLAFKKIAHYIYGNDGCV